jgi:hypothetical protein
MKMLTVILLSLLTLSACHKSVDVPVEKDTVVVKQGHSKLVNLDSMQKFLQLNAAQVYHEVQPQGGWWYHIESVKFDTGTVKHNTVMFPSGTFGEWSVTCQTARSIKFYYDTYCPENNVIQYFITNVTIYAGDKIFKWYNATMSSTENRDLYNYCIKNNKWRDNPKEIVIHVRPKVSKFE